MCGTVVRPNVSAVCVCGAVDVIHGLIVKCITVFNRVISFIYCRKMSVFVLICWPYNYYMIKVIFLCSLTSFLVPKRKKNSSVDEEK